MTDSISQGPVAAVQTMKADGGAEPPLVRAPLADEAPQVHPREAFAARRERATLHTISNKQTFDFTGLDDSRNFSAPLVRSIDVNNAVDIQLIVRVHSFDFTADAAIDVLVEAVSITDEEPESDFVGPIVASARLTSGMGPTPLLLLGGLTTPVFGHMVRVRLVATKPPSTSVIATLSIDLRVREN